MVPAQYKILGDGITVEPQLNSSGTGIIDLHVIPYEILSGPAAGTRRTVKVTAPNYTAAQVKQAVEADLTATHQIASLGNPPPQGV
jgi:hypothetical protein